MPDRPGVDDSPALQDLLRIWTAGAEDLQARQTRVFGEIERLLVNPGDGVRLDRLQIQARRLDDLQEVAFAVADDAAQATRSFIESGGFHEIYAAGAARNAAAFSFTTPHRAAVEVLAQDTFGDVLRATRFMEDDAKAWVRRVGRELTGFKLTGGETAVAQGRRFARELAKEFGPVGIGAMTYADGSRRSFGHYGEMLLRAKTAVAYNVGTLNHARVLGIGVFEILDGSECGLTEHNDPMVANTMLVGYETAQSWPISHPNCRRAINPRPDVDPRDIDDASSLVSRESRADQTAFEAELRRQGKTASGRSSRGRGRPSRARRDAGGRRDRPTTRRAPRANSRAKAEAKAGNARRRAQIEAARAEFMAQQQAQLAQQRLQAVGSGRAPAEILERYGVTEAQWLNGRALAGDIKRDVRAAAKAEADRLSAWMQDNSLDKLTRPKRLDRKVDLVSGRSRSVRSQSGYDVLETLDDASTARVRRRMVDSELYSPDVLGEQVRRVTNLDLSDDEAMDWLIDRWLHEDGLRSVASGRLPKYADAQNLIPSDYEMAGYDLERLFGQSLDDAAGHVAAVQADEARVFAQRVLTDREGPAAWTMDFGDYVRELEQLEQIAGTATVEAGGIPEGVRLRLLDLAPPELDPTGALAPTDLFEAIRITAQQGGLLP